MIDKKQQHTVSRFYLKRFAQERGDKVLWQFGKDGTGPTRVSPRAATAEEHFYSIPRPDGTWDASIEEALEKVEAKAAPALLRLERDESANLDDREIIAYFIGLLLFRVSAVANHAKEEDARLHTVEGAIRFIDNERSLLEQIYSKEEVDNYVQEIRDRGIGLTAVPKHHLRVLAYSPLKAAKTICLMEWEVCRACEGQFFITSDNPAFPRRPHRLFDPGIVGIQRDDLGVELGFPLSREAYLLATWKPLAAHTGTVSRLRVRELNRRTVLSAANYVFSPQPSEEIAALVAEHAAFQVKHPSVINAPPRRQSRHLRRARNKRAE
jgi:hypothetical protein